MDSWFTGQGRKGCDVTVLPGFVSHFRDYGLPLYKVFGNKAAPHDMVQVKFKITPSSARAYLRNLLTTEREGTFDFLGLPPELRLEIYEYVLTYSGLYKPSPKHDSGYTSQLVPLASAHEPDVSSLYRNYGDKNCIGCLQVINLPPMQEILALVTVNRQIYSEAMPVFYAVNHFYVQKISGLNHFVRNLSKERLRHVTSITFDYRHDTAKEVQAFVGTLALISEHATNLKKITVQADDEMWFTVTKLRNSVPKYEESSDLPGIQKLCKLLSTVPKFEIVGECPRIQSYIRATTPRVLELEAREQEEKDEKKRAKELARKEKVAAMKWMKAEVVKRQSAVEVMTGEGMKASRMAD